MRWTREVSWPTSWDRWRRRPRHPWPFVERIKANFVGWRVGKVDTSSLVLAVEHVLVVSRIWRQAQVAPFMTADAYVLDQFMARNIKKE